MNICPVCGYNHLTGPSYDPDGYGTFEICSCCGFEFGVDDYPYEQKDQLILKWRQTWINKECKWWSNHKSPPKNWNPHEQLKNLIQ